MKEPTAVLDLDQVSVREILNTLADGAYITDLDRRILFWNRTAEAMTGWGASAVTGRTCYDNLLVHADKDGHPLCGQEYCPLHRAIVTGENSHEPLLVFAQHKQGHRVPVEVSVAPIRDRTGKTVGGIELFRDVANLMEDLGRAGTIQRHSLELRLPDDPRIRFEVRYSPEEIVGGDFYRVEALGADRYAVMVADVMGHGVASALYTMQLRSLWEECRADLVAPARFMGELNRRLHKLVSGGGYFATAVFALVDLARGEVVYVRGGHPASFLFHAAGNVTSMGCRSPALGLRSGAEFVEGTLPFGPGDTLLFFTDGALEIVNRGDQELGEQGLLQLLQREGFGGEEVALERIETRLLEYSNGIRLPDDLTLLSVRRTALGSPLNI